MFGINIKLIAAGIIASAVISIGIYVFALQSEIKVANANLTARQSVIDSYALKVDVLKESNSSMAKAITTLNTKYRQYEAASKSAKETLIRWKAKSDSKKFEVVNKIINPTNTDLSKATCEEGIRLNRMISELKYEEL